jgi:hypothetical protein
MRRFGSRRLQRCDSRNPGCHAASHEQRHAVTARSPILAQRFAPQRLVLLEQVAPSGGTRGQIDGRVLASFFLRRAIARSRERG